MLNTKQRPFCVVAETSRPALEDGDSAWSEMELTGCKQPVQADVDNNSDADLPPADKTTGH